jgi:anthranilate synthase component 2
VVSKESLSKEFEITSENDEGIITSISHKKYDVKGVQFHPESILTEYGLKMIENWIKS